MKKNKYIILILILILFSIVGYIIYNKNHNTDIADYNKINITGNCISENDLYEYIKMIPLPTSKTLKSNAYIGKNVNSENDKTTILEYILHSVSTTRNIEIREAIKILNDLNIKVYDENTVFYKKNDIIDLFKKYYNIDFSKTYGEKISISFGDVYITDNYVILYTPNSTDIQKDIDRITFTYDVEKKDNNLFIKERVLLIKENEESYDLYANMLDYSENKNSIYNLKKDKNSNNIFSNQNNKINPIIKNYIKNAAEYEHIFKCSNDKCYWYSSVQIENDFK